MMSKLKPCPFCGAKAENVLGADEAGYFVYTVRCVKCGVETCNTEGELYANRAWNKRVNP